MSEGGNGGVRAVSFVAAALLLVAFLYLLSSSPFPYATYTSPERLPVTPGSDLGGGMSLFLWDFRGLDLIIQTLVLFATAISCLALLREEKH